MNEGVIMFHNKKMFIAGAVLALAVIGLIFNVAFKTSATYMKPSEFKNKSDKGALREGTPSKLVGNVTKGSVSAINGKLKFKVEDSTTTKSNPKKTMIAVSYDGTVPSGFAEGRYVILDGSYTGGNLFNATSLATKCPSKYKAKVETPKTKVKK
jgi:cytochrome c-type biogenesis protein CcmE